mmetsp:Transcript_42062/g.121523  ORF Transcript_42062/g.121523 Transcript_42062/m.121523 type:complete len:386 (-) Transcript_42062:7-1164(-)
MDPWSPVPPHLQEALPPEPPPEHRAHVACKVSGQPGSSNLRCTFNFGKFQIQTTALPVGGYISASLSICKHLYAKMADEGKTKEECIALRNELYAKVQEAIKAHGGGTPKPGPAEAKPSASKAQSGAKPAATSDAAAVEAKPPATTANGGAKRSTSSQSLDAAAAEVKPAPAPSEANGQEAPPDWESKALQELGEVQGASDVQLKFERKAALWYFHYQKVRFQTTVKAVGGSIPIAERVALLCYARFATGETKEQVTEYRAGLYQQVNAHVPVGHAVAPAKRKAQEEAAAPAPKRPRGRPRKGAETKEVGAANEASSDSDSDSSSSSDDGEGEGATPAVGRPPPLPPMPRSGTVGAKMLVRAGLRCACHFLHVSACPDSRGSARP